MKRDQTFVKSRGQALGVTPSGEHIRVPLIPGVLKHLTLEQLEPLLQRPAVLEKYTSEALRWAPWQCLRDFPPHWLRLCLTSTELRAGRKMALNFFIDAALRRATLDAASPAKIEGA
jgi:hypothetical protein